MQFFRLSIFPSAYFNEFPKWWTQSNLRWGFLIVQIPFLGQFRGLGDKRQCKGCVPVSDSTAHLNQGRGEEMSWGFSLGWQFLLYRITPGADRELVKWVITTMRRNKRTQHSPANLEGCDSAPWLLGNSNFFKPPPSLPPSCLPSLPSPNSLTGPQWKSCGRQE